MCTLALVVALSANESVFSLVLIAWSALASAFGPLLVVYALGQRPGEPLAIAMVVTGVVIAAGWRYLGLDQTVIYEAVPGMLGGIAVFAGGRALGFMHDGAPRPHRAGA